MSADRRPDGRPRVVVTGLGVVSPIGCDLDGFHAAQLAGRSGAGPLTRYPVDDEHEHPVRIAAEVDLPPELEPDRRERATSDRCTHLTLAAAGLAVADGGVAVGPDDPGRYGVVFGSGAGGLPTFGSLAVGWTQRGIAGVRPRGIPMGMVNEPSGSLARRYGFTGPCMAVASACASASDAIAAAYRTLVCGDLDVVLTGGAESLIVPWMLLGFARLGVLSTRNDDPAGACRPFSADREGFVLGEGAAVLVLETADHARRRGAPVHAEVLGYGRSCDAHHITMPHPEGAGARTAITAALRSAGVAPADVDHVNTHGTCTPLNDAAEAKALHAVFGDHLPDVALSATKGVTGHSLGAAGGLEAVATIQSLRSGLIPPIANLERPDPELGPLALSAEVVEATPRVALSNSFGFGGHNVVLAFGRT